MRRTRLKRTGHREQPLAIFPALRDIPPVFSGAPSEAGPTAAARPVEPTEASAAADLPVASAVEPSPDVSPRHRPAGAVLRERIARFRRTGQHQAAVQTLRELLAAEPDSVATRLEVARGLEELGELECALTVAELAVEMFPTEADARIVRGSLYGRLKRYLEAEADLQGVLREHPLHPEAHFQFGLLQWRRGLNADAASSFRQSLELRADHAVCHYYLAEALNQLDDVNGAMREVEQALALDPTHARSYQLMGRLLDRQRRTEDAMAMYHRARELAAR